jgi:hypothetical protein
MPTALDAGWYISKGFQVSCQRQYVRATGLPEPSTWASAASSSGVMTAVECAPKSGPYCRQVSDGVLWSAPLTGKNISAGLRITWYNQFSVNRSTRMTAVPATNRTAIGAAHNSPSACRPERESSRTNLIRTRRARVLREPAEAARERDITSP